MTQIGLEALKLQETKRSNIANETIRQGDLDETKRSNLVNEKIKQGTLDESIRSNKAREKETNRANLAQEKETNRANLAREKETNRANLANEKEKNRSALEQEAQRRYESNLDNLNPAFARSMADQLADTNSLDKRGGLDSTLFDRTVADLYYGLSDLVSIRIK